MNGEGSKGRRGGWARLEESERRKEGSHDLREGGRLVEGGITQRWGPNTVPQDSAL